MSSITFIPRGLSNKRACFESVLSSSGCRLLAHESGEHGINHDRVAFEIDGEEREIDLFYILRSLGNGGWSDKPWIFRIQVSKIDPNWLPITSKSSISVLLGVAFLHEEPFIIGWNPFNYISHATNRSCYAEKSDILKLLDNPVVKVKSGNNITCILARATHFKKFVCLYQELFGI